MFHQKLFLNVADQRASADQTGCIIFWIFYYIGCHKLLRMAFEFLILNNIGHMVVPLKVKILADALSKYLFDSRVYGLHKYNSIYYINIIAPRSIAIYNQTQKLSSGNWTQLDFGSLKCLDRKCFRTLQVTGARQIKQVVLFFGSFITLDVINFSRRLLNLSSRTIWVIRCSRWLYKSRQVCPQIKQRQRPSSVRPDIEFKYSWISIDNSSWSSSPEKQSRLYRYEKKL